MNEQTGDISDKPELTPEYINSLPVIRYTGPINIINTPDELADALRILSIERYVGFDTESRPSFKKGQNYPISIIQLATLNEVFIIRVGNTGFSDDLIKFFESDTEKVGVGLQDDVRKLAENRRFTPNKMVDLSDIARRYGHVKSSLRALSASFLQHRIVKSAQKTNWARVNLTETQLRYAATDAWVCLLIHPFLVDLNNK